MDTQGNSALTLPVLTCIVTCIINICSGAAVPRDVQTFADGLDYLSKFGLLEGKNDPKTGALRRADSLKDPIIHFQRMAGINQTGVIDSETLKMMNLPRCGVTDKIGYSNAARRKRYALQGSRWPKTEITYKVSRYTKDVGPEYVDYELQRAFKVWSEVTTLTFIKKTDGPVDINIIFARTNHGDGDPFDGPGRTLAHAYFPRFGGDAHFDEDENWTVNSRRGTNFFQVAAHEIGHSLGLAHSDVYTALMAPFYRGYNNNIKLAEDDQMAIQELYGKVGDKDGEKDKTDTRPTQDPNEFPKNPTEVPEICNEVDYHIDGITTTADGLDYVFMGDYYWRLKSNLGIDRGYPREISTDWEGLPSNIDAVLTWPNGKTFFFKGAKYWKFTNMKLASGYPRKIRFGFSGIPDDIDAAFVWSGNGKTYFIKGAKYWRYTGLRVDYGYPKPLSVWRGLPERINAAFKWRNGKTYFFKGTEYYRFNDTFFRVDKKYPRPTSRIWLGCQNRLVDGTNGKANTSIQGNTHPHYGIKASTKDNQEYNGTSSNASVNLLVLLTAMLVLLLTNLP